jgi:hypothetical protein
VSPLEQVKNGWELSNWRKSNAVEHVSTCIIVAKTIRNRSCHDGARLGDHLCGADYSPAPFGDMMSFSPRSNCPLDHRFSRKRDYSRPGDILSERRGRKETRTLFCPGALGPTRKKQANLARHCLQCLCKAVTRADANSHVLDFPALLNHYMRPAHMWTDNLRRLQ